MEIPRTIMFDLFAQLPASWRSQVMLKYLNLQDRLAFFRQDPSDSLSWEAFGLTFPNPIGLASGFDQKGDYINVLGRLGFGFIEVGPITPEPSKKKKADIYDNIGLDALIENLRKSSYTGILGVSLNCHAHANLTNQITDYWRGLLKAYQYSHYSVLNLDAVLPQHQKRFYTKKHLENFFYTLKDKQFQLAQRHHSKPIFLKASQTNRSYLQNLVDVAVHYDLDGLILQQKQEALEIIRNKIPLIMIDPDSVENVFSSRIALIQFSDMFTHQGPKIIRESLARIEEYKNARAEKNS